MSNWPRQLAKLDCCRVKKLCSPVLTLLMKSTTLHTTHRAFISLFTPVRPSRQRRGDSNRRAITASQRRDSVEPLLWKRSRPPRSDLSVPSACWAQHRWRCAPLTLTERDQPNIKVSAWRFMSLTNFMRLLSEYRLDENFIACFKSQSEDVIWSLGLLIWLGYFFFKNVLLLWLPQKPQNIYLCMCLLIWTSL